jgi:hypothetical protein
VLVTYRGDISQLAAALARAAGRRDYGARGRMRSRGQAPPLPPPPPAAAAAAAPPQPRRRRPGRRNAGQAMKQGPDQIALRSTGRKRGDARFIVSDANREAFEHFRKWSMWPVKATILTGPRRSADAARAQLRRARRRPLFDDAERATRRSCSTPGTRPRTAAGRWSWSPTRCRRPGRRAARPADPAGGDAGRAIGHPDDALFAALIQLLFADRGLHIPRRRAALHGRAAAPRLLDRERAVEAVDRFAIAERARLPADDPPGADRSG